MSEEIPKCNSCGQPMFEIGETGKNVQIMDVQNDVLVQVGIRCEKLFQCPECKDVKIK